MCWQIQRDREDRIGSGVCRYVILTNIQYYKITKTFRRILTLSYYQKNYWAQVQKKWRQTKGNITDPEAIREGDEITSRIRPTTNQIGTLEKIFAEAPRRASAAKN